MLNLENQYLNPRPEVSEKAIYEPAGPVEEFMVPLLKEQIEKLLSTYLFTKGNSAIALDVGCGRQPFREYLEGLGYSYLGLDVQQNQEGSVDLVCEIDKPLSQEILQYKKIDLIFCTEVMEHVADWQTTFRNFHDLLVSDGYLLITCPQFYMLHEEPYDFWRPTIYAFQYFANQFKFKIVYQVSAGDAWDILGTLIANLSPRPAQSSLKARVASRLTRYAQQWLMHLLLHRKIQKFVHLHQIFGNFYLSNIILLKKA